LEDLTAMKEGRAGVEIKDQPPCGNWCERSLGLEVIDRIDRACFECDLYISKNRIPRLATYAILDIAKFARSLPGWLSKAYNVGAFTDSEIMMIGAAND
jgi:hypothetical protein